MAVTSKLARPVPRRSRAGLLLPLAALAYAGLSFVTPNTVSRRQVLRDGRVALAARGGADDDEEYFDDYAFADASSFKVGQEVSGVVTKLVRFGAFVDMGTDKEGLVPLSKMADGRTEKAEDVVAVGDSVQCWVVEVNGDKVTLTMSEKKIGPPGERAPREPRGRKEKVDVTPFESLAGGDFVDGTVVTVAGFGAFVEIAVPGGESMAQGLVHITQIKNGFVENVEDEVSVGQAVKVRVLSVDAESGKIGLSMKEPGSGGDDRPPRAKKTQQKDVQAFSSMPDDEWVTGTVKNIVKFGAFVEVSPSGGGPSAEGLVHISQIQDGFLEDPSTVLEVGQEVKVRVIEVDADKGKVGLSMKEKKEPVAEETAEA